MTKVTVAFREEHAPALADWVGRYHPGDGEVRSTDGGWRVVTVDMGESGGPGQEWFDLVREAGAAGLEVEPCGPGQLRLVPQYTPRKVDTGDSANDVRLLAVHPALWPALVDWLEHERGLTVGRIPESDPPVWITSPITMPPADGQWRLDVLAWSPEALRARAQWEAVRRSGAAGETGGPAFPARRVNMERDVLPAVNEWLEALEPHWTPRAAGNTYDDPVLRWFEVDDPAIWESLENLAAERGWSLTPSAFRTFTLAAAGEAEG